MLFKMCPCCSCVLRDIRYVYKHAITINVKTIERYKCRKHVFTFMVYCIFYKHIIIMLVFCDTELLCSTRVLKQRSRDKITAISQTTFSNQMSRMKINAFWLKVHWSLFLRVQLTKCLYLTQWQFNFVVVFLWCIYGSLGLDRLKFSPTHQLNVFHHPSHSSTQWTHVVMITSILSKWRPGVVLTVCKLRKWEKVQVKKMNDCNIFVLQQVCDI